MSCVPDIRSVGLRSLGEIVDAPYGGRPEKGWIVWWRGRSIEVCQQVIYDQHLALQRQLGIVDHAVRIG